MKHSPLSPAPLARKAAAAALCALALAVASCSSSKQNVQPPPTTVPVVVQPQINVLDLPGKNLPGYTNPYPAGTYEHFVAQPAYPKTMGTYTDDVLLTYLTKANSKLVICIPQQRARLYVGGRVALDWPVSTGTHGHETPTGVFRVMEKKEDHHSNRYGRFVNDKGRTVDGNADTANGVPEGLTFAPAAMPYWHRLTWDGVGIHAGKVIPGRRLSHGCIRSPHSAVKKFFDHSVVGLETYITRAVEDYAQGGKVRPIDVKYRPIPGNDYTDLVQPVKTIPAAGAAAPAAATQAPAPQAAQATPAA